MSLIAAMEAAVAETEGIVVVQDPSNGMCSSSSSSSDSDSEDGKSLGAAGLDDDEEIEYGDGRVVSSRPTGQRRKKPTPPVASPSHALPTSSLVSSFNTPEPARSTADGGQTAQQPAAASGASSFGIAYKPMRAPQTQERYGGSVQHQRDLDLLLEDAAAATSSELFRLSADPSRPATADDDFDDFNAPIAPSIAADIVALAMAAQRQATEQQEASGGPASITPTDKEPAQDEEEDEEPGEAPPSFQSPSTDMGLRAAAEAALHMLTDTYARGFGDMEARSLSEATPADQPGTGPATSSAAVTGKVSQLTIAEEDEEEAERREEEEQLAADQRKEEEQRRLAALAQEWDSLAPPTTRSRGAAAQQRPAEEDVTYETAMAHFRAKYAEPKPFVAEGGAKVGWSLLGGPVALSAEEARERDQVGAITGEPFEPTDPLHYHLIRKLYRVLTGRSNCPMTGQHWEAVGFQGTDPRTDLNRSMGVWSLVQALYFLETNPTLVQALFQQSQDEVAHWPFLLVSINFTRDAVTALKAGTANKECRRRGSVSAVVNSLHQALFYDFHLRLAAQPGVHHAVHLSAVRAAAAKDIMALDKKYQAQLKKGLSGAVIKAAPPGAGDVFTVLEEAQERDGGEASSADRLTTQGRRHLVGGSKP